MQLSLFENRKRETVSAAEQLDEYAGRIAANNV